MKILFMGTPEFARVSLEYLINNNYNPAGVITQPDKPQGRKMILTPPPVKEYALLKNIEVYQPVALKKRKFQDLLENINPDIIIVVAYGKMLPKNVIDFPKYGCVNVHASLLPKYRGAAPINAAIMQGEKITGITTIYMNEGIDTGDMILQEQIKIGENENFGELHDRMAVLGGEVLIKTLKQIENDTIKREKQMENNATYAKKIDNEMCVIDWNKSAREIYDKIRALSPNIGASAYFENKKLKIFKSEIIEIPENLKDKKNGEFIINKKNLDVKADNSALRICELQLEGSKRMSAFDFINGRKITGGILK